ncbi:MAG: type II secretion system GspH family protein [Lachnospiraceae bacterium]|nr:type II secretion system GspH family protein [Lachnospiraceae bacterium]MDE7238460.1 type II secretion system GspH family protein [Lachnospiraceae bacterium]
MEKKRMNDKGFSLVELIIVIAIMAILIGLLAPQYLKFVERSKKSADRDTVDEIIRTVQMDYADPESTKNVDGASITLSPTSVATITEASGVATTDGLAAVLSGFGLNTSDMKLKSSKWHVGTSTGANVTSVTITFKYENETVTATVTANGTSNAPVDDNNTTITGKSATTTP